MHRKTIYVSGPISKGKLSQNVNRATAAFVALAKAGFAPLCPHWSVFSAMECNESSLYPSSVYAVGTAGGAPGLTHDDWLAIDLPWVARADAVLRLPGESAGADREVAEAGDHGIPVLSFNIWPDETYDQALSRGVGDVEKYFADEAERNAGPEPTPTFTGVLRPLGSAGVMTYWGGPVGGAEKAPAEPAGHPGYLALLDEMKELHTRKAADYGRGADPFANVRASSRFGIPAWVGVMVRANDKMERIQSFIANGSLKNESVEDSLMDLAAYALIALALRREDAAKAGAA